MRESQTVKSRGSVDTSMRACKNFKNYAGIGVPKCNKGKGCDACNALYVSRHPMVEAMALLRSIDASLKLLEERC